MMIYSLLCEGFEGELEEGDMYLKFIPSEDGHQRER